jgi:hypothetical protein
MMKWLKAFWAGIVAQIEKDGERMTFLSATDGEYWIEPGLPEGKKISEKKLKAAMKSDCPKLRKKAQFAENIRK